MVFLYMHLYRRIYVQLYFLNYYSYCRILFSFFRVLKVYCSNSNFLDSCPSLKKKQLTNVVHLRLEVFQKMAMA